MEKKMIFSSRSCLRLWLACVLFIVAGGTAWAESASAENTFVEITVEANNPITIGAAETDFYIGTEDSSVEVTIDAMEDFDLVKPDPDTTTFPITINAGGSQYYEVKGIPPETMDGAGTIYVVKVDLVEAYCDKFGDTGTFGENPEIFPGGEWDFGQPDRPPPYWWLPGTSANPSSKVLKVFFKYIKDSNDEPGPFDIDLKAIIMPDGISDDMLNIKWYRLSGPSSGSFDKTDEREVKFQNPTKGGLYKFRMEMQPGGCFMLSSDAWVLLPKAGGEVTDWMVSEVPSLVTRAQDWKDAVRDVAISNGLDVADFLETAWKAIATCDFDYQGLAGSPTKRYSFRDSDRPAGHTPDSSIPGMSGDKENGDWDEPSFATLRGIVVSRAKLNNAMYAVWGRELGYTENELKAGAFWNSIGRGLWDDSTSQNAVELGSDLYDENDGGGDLSSVITKTRAKSIQSPDSPSGLNDVNLWPDTTSVSSGFSLPTMPRDYDSLEEGENEGPRGRLF